jgi:hypothetical protein
LAPSASRASWKLSKSPIHSSAKSCGVTSVLFSAMTMGRRVLYRMLHAYSMLAMKVPGVLERGVSTTKTRTVGSVPASMSVMTAPLADHVKTSICPGVSTTK